MAIASFSQLTLLYAHDFYSSQELHHCALYDERYSE